MKFPMKMSEMGWRSVLRLVVAVSALVLTGGLVWAQDEAQPRSQVQPRIQSEIGASQATVLRGSAYPLAQSRWDAGRMPGDRQLSGMTIFFNRSAEQEKELKALLAAQQDSSSPQYHKWLTPAQFGERFGMPAADIAKVRSWLESQGFTVQRVNAAGTGIYFSGTVAQAEQAFSTQMHYYRVNNERHFGPAGPISVPSAIAEVTTAVTGLHDMRPRPMFVRPTSSQKRPHRQYTIGTTDGDYAFFAPGDIDVVYDLKSLKSSGNDGTGQTIVILGQSAIQTGDITSFQDAAGIAEKAPTTTIVPGTGDPTINPGCANGGDYNCGGDEGESDLDIEWASATAPGATINFVYTGGATDDGTPTGNPLYGVFDSFDYAVQNNIGNILNFSYGACETELSSSDFEGYEQDAAQAAAQGQSITAASGDQGSTACSGFTDLTTAQQEALAVNYPASSAYVTAVGGTEITEANATPGSGNPYWEDVPSDSTTGYVLTSALSYIPEVAWNDDDSQYGISASGGGVSTFTARPSWQTGVPGITSGSMRLVPDVSLYASPNYPSYLFCTSDEYDWDVPDGQSGSCSAGEFWDANSGYFTLGGGTSFASPIFAGMLAILNQARGYTAGQGQVNTELYTLAADSTTYASAFHDITTGDNKCSAGSSYCSGEIGYATTVGYDEVTGLGSVDLAKLISAWPSSGGGTLVSTTTTVTASATTPAVGASDSFTVTVTPASGTTAPTGTVAVTVDGTAITGSPFTLTANGSSATATFPYTFTTSGSHTVSVSYSGDTSFSTSTGSTTVTASATSAVGTTTTVAASTTTPTVGTADTFTVTVKPASGTTAPAGTVAVTVDGTAITGSPFTLTTSGSSATATFQYTFTSAGTHTISVAYTPTDSTAFSSSNGSTTVTAQSSTPTVIATTTAVSASNSSPTVGTADTFTVTVTPGSGTTAPTGTVAVTVDGTAVTGSPFAVTASGANATATFQYTFTTAGSHSVSATYSGDANFSTSAGAISVMAQTTPSGPGSFTLSFNPSTLTVGQGSSGTEVITVTPTNYVGTVNLQYETSNDSALSNMCIFAGSGFNTNGNSITVSSGSTAVSGQLTVDTRGADCVSSDVASAMALRGYRLVHRVSRSPKPQASRTGAGPLAGGAALAGLLLMGFFGKKSKKLRNLAAVFLLIGVGLAISACGGGGGGSSTPDPSKGTYTITFTGQDSGSSSITASSSFTLTID